jgi:hypothetical protein
MFFSADWPIRFKKVPLWEECSRKEVWLSDELFLCNAKPKAARQAPVCKKLVEDTLELPAIGELPCPQGRTGARISNVPCRNQRQQIEKAQPEILLRLFLVRAEIKAMRSAQVGADMEPRKSPLDFVFVRRLIKSSMASTVESGLNTLRNTHTRLSSSGGSSNSSLRVPER